MTLFEPNMTGTDDEKNMQVDIVRVILETEVLLNSSLEPEVAFFFQNVNPLKTLFSALQKSTNRLSTKVKWDCEEWQHLIFLFKGVLFHNNHDYLQN